MYLPLTIVDLEISRGASWPGPVTLNLYNPDGSPYDLTDCSFVAAARTSHGTHVCDFTIDLYDALGGTALLNFTGETQDLLVGSHLWDALLVTAEGVTLHQPVFGGNLLVYKTSSLG